MILPVCIPLERLERVLRAMRTDPGLTPAEFAPERVSGNVDSRTESGLQGLQQGGQGVALRLVGGEQRVKGRVFSLQ